MEKRMSLANNRFSIGQSATISFLEEKKKKN